MEKLPKKWWMQFPKRESRTPKDKPTTEKPKLSIGDKILLKRKPDKVRKVIGIEWHRHRYEYVYVIETSSLYFEPYWFYEQLEVMQ